MPAYQAQPVVHHPIPKHPLYKALPGDAMPAEPTASAFKGIWDNEAVPAAAHENTADFYHMFPMDLALSRPAPLQMPYREAD